jgi:hypothetical protein
MNAHTTPYPRTTLRRKAVAVSAGLLIAVASTMATTARAADQVGSTAAFPPEPGATLAGDLILWQGEILANKATNGFSVFTTNGASGASPIAAGIVKTMSTFNGLLIWIEGTTVKTANPGGTVVTLGTVPAGSDSLRAVGTQLWISKPGGIDRYAPTPTALGGATALAGTFNPASKLRMAIGADTNVWVIESNPAAGGVDTLTRWSASAATQVGATTNFANSAANPSAIVAGPDSAAWIVEPGINSVARVEAGGSIVEFALPGGANPEGIVSGPENGVWVAENGLNNLARLSFANNTFTRVAYSAPSAFGMKGLAVGADNNIWAAGTNANKVAKFGTTPLATTTTSASTTTIAATTTAATTTTLPATTTTLAPATIPPTVSGTIPAKRVCIKTVTKRVKVKGKTVKTKVCTKYKK